MDKGLLGPSGGFIYCEYLLRVRLPAMRCWVGLFLIYEVEIRQSKKGAIHWCFSSRVRAPLLLIYVPHLFARQQHNLHTYSVLNNECISPEFRV